MQRVGNDPPNAGGFDRRRLRAGWQRHRHERVPRRAVVGESAGAERNLRADSLRLSSFELGAPRRRRRAPRRGSRRRAFDRLVDRLPAGAAAQVRGERAVEVDPGGTALRTQPRRAHEDARRAESALRAAGVGEACRQSGAFGRLETLDGGHHPPGDADRRRDARDAGIAVDEHGAASALPLRRAAVLRRHDAEALAQDREERFPANAVDLDGCAVAGERDPIPSCAHGRAG